MDYWMIIFDEQEIEKKTNDSQNRGFKNGHADLGFGREGVSQSAEESQRGNQEILFAIPHIIHKDKFDYKKLGNLPDLIQLLADKYIVDNNKVSPLFFFGSAWALDCKWQNHQYCQIPFANGDVNANFNSIGTANVGT